MKTTLPARDLSWTMSSERIPSSQWRRFPDEFNPDPAATVVALRLNPGC